MRIERYDWAGGSEAMLRFGPADGPQVIAVLPLFEEANRTRAALVDVLLRLAGIGIGSALPDLPGTGESVVPTIDARLTDWRAAFAGAAAALGRPAIVAWRGGALVDGEADGRCRWYLSPVDGAQAIRELRRVQVAGGGSDYAGNRIAEAMMDQLGQAALADAPTIRTVRLTSDPRPADRHVAGTPLWRASEPTVEPALQQLVAEDIAAWVAACGA